MAEDYDKLLDKAYNLHIEGKLDEAKLLYEKLISLQGDNLDVLNLYAQLNFSLKNFDTALKIFYQIYEKTKLDEIKINIIKVYFIQKDFRNVLKTIATIENKDTQILRFSAQANFSLNNFNEAIVNYLEILKSKEATLSDIFNLSLAYLKINDFNNALKYALEAFNINSKDISICLHIASIYEKLKDDENQLKYLLLVSEIEPSVDLFYNIGVLYRKTGDDEKALDYFNAIVDVDKNHKFALLNIARIFQNHDKNVSIQILEELVQKYPKDSSILSQLYIVYKEMMNNTKACEVAKKLVELEPKKAYPYAFLGDSLHALGKFEEAISVYLDGEKYAENKEDFIIPVARLYSVLNEGEKAIELFEKNCPNLTKTHSAYAFITLREKKLTEAREAMYNHLISLYTEEEIEQRAVRFFYKLNIDKKFGINEADFKTLKNNKPLKENEKIQHYLKKDLHFQNPDNKRVLVYNANGAGDLIMFCRYLSILEKHTKNILIQAPNSMQRLLKYNFPNYEILSNDNIVDDNSYDYSTSFYNLLVNLDGISLNDIPYSSKYLDINKELIEEKSQLDIMNTSKKKIGIFWMGNPVVMPQRFIKLDELKPLFDIKNSQIYSFQISNMDYESEDISTYKNIIELEPYIKDYADTAALLKNIDVLVTIDTSIANLAGALGVKTFLLLPYESEWRWFHDTDTTPWYDSIKIFKQTIPYFWDDVIERVKNELTI